MKKVSIIGSVGIPARYGGFETFVHQFVKRVNTKIKITIFCSRFSYKNREKRYLSSDRIFLPFKANGIQSVPYDILSIIIGLFKTDTLLILGISGCIILPFIKPFHRKRIIVSIDGLDPKREKWTHTARIFLKLSEYCAIKYSDLIIADNKYIHDYINLIYKKESALVEYGSDHSVFVEPRPEDYVKYPFLREQYYLSIGRIEKENNCELILNTFFKMKETHFVYIGNWNHSKYSKSLKNKYNSCDNIILLDEFYDIDLINMFRCNCTIFIHGNSAGGTNPGLIEAMHVGVPIIAYDVVFNRDVTENCAFYFTKSKDIENGISKYKSDESFRVKKQHQLKNISIERFNWDKIVKQYLELF